MSATQEYTKSALISEFEWQLLQDVRKYLGKKLFGSISVAFRDGRIANYERKETEDVIKFND
jgi:hypothetical protein